MPEKPDDKKREGTPNAEGGTKRKGRFLLVGAIGGVMLIEGVGIFVLTRLINGGPQSAAASVQGLEHSAGPDAVKAAPADSELLLAQFRAINDRSGQNVLYDVKVYGRVKSDKLEKVQKLLESKKASVEDRLTKVVRSADPQYFKEPGLETIRRQILHELAGVFGEDDLVSEILLPSLMWYNAGG